MRVLTAADILNQTDLKKEQVPVPEFGDGVSVFVREMTGTERDDWEAAMSKMRGGKVEVNRKNFRATLLVRCICNETGERLFSDADAAKLGQVGAGAISRLYNAAARINGITKEDQEELTEAFPE